MLTFCEFLSTLMAPQAAKEQGGQHFAAFPLSDMALIVLRNKSILYHWELVVLGAQLAFP